MYHRGECTKHVDPIRTTCENYVYRAAAFCVAFRASDVLPLIKKCQVYLDHLCARSIFERVLDKYTWIKNKPAT